MRDCALVAARTVAVMFCGLLGCCASAIRISPSLPAVITAVSGQFPERPMSLQETSRTIKSGGFREPRIISDISETGDGLFRRADNSDQGAALGAGVGLFGGLAGGLVAVSKGDLRIEDYNKTHHEVLPVSFWSSLSPSLGLHVRVESKPDGAMVFVHNVQTSLQKTAEFYAPSTVLATVRVERRGLLPMSLREVTDVHSLIEGDAEVLNFICRLTPIPQIGRTHASPLRSN